MNKFLLAIVFAQLQILRVLFMPASLINSSVKDKKAARRQPFIRTTMLFQ